MKRIFSILAIIVCLCLLLSATVWANSPPATLDNYLSSPSLFDYLLFIGISIAASVMIEWGISFAFHLGHSRLVIITNVVSQIVMQGISALLSLSFLFLLISSLSVTAILLIEAFVVLGEWGVYCFVINDRTPGKLFLFTLCANLASFVAGFLPTLF